MSAFSTTTNNITLDDVMGMLKLIMTRLDHLDTRVSQLSDTVSALTDHIMEQPHTSQSEPLSLVEVITGSSIMDVVMEDQEDQQFEPAPVIPMPQLNNTL